MSGSRRTARRRPDGPIREEVVREIDAHLRARERHRDRLAEESRSLRRRAQGLMGRLHEGPVDAREVDRIARDAKALAGRMGADGGLAHDALQESVEAILLARVVRGDGRAFPGPADLGLPPEAYLGGLGDLVGEVRRLALSALTVGNLAGAQRHLRSMEHLYETLCRFESPRAIVALKPKQDAARSLVERTRGDVALAAVLARAGAGGLAGPREEA